MARKKRSNPNVGPDLGESWLMTTLTVEKLAPNFRHYHIYSKVDWGLSQDEMLGIGGFEAIMENWRSQTMIVYETQLKFDHYIPLGTPLL